MNDQLYGGGYKRTGEMIQMAGEIPTSESSTGEYKRFDFPNIGKKHVLGLIVVVLILAAVYFASTTSVANLENATKQKLDDLANEQARKSGMAVEQIDREDIKIRELAKWTGEGTNAEFAPGEIPDTLKVSGFENLYVVGIHKQGTQDLDLRFEIENLGNEKVTFNGVEAIISAEFINNPGVFKEYTVVFYPQGEKITLRGWATCTAGANINENPEIYKNFVKSYEVVKINFR